MDELANRWYQAGSLLIQAGFLIAAVWSVRAILKNVRASQEQMGALLRLTLGGASLEENARAARPTPYLLDGWPEAKHSDSPDPRTGKNQLERGSRHIWTGLAGWLQQPMASSGINPWRRAVRWLQAPAGS
jgi:hypothetical protein